MFHSYYTVSKMLSVPEGVSPPLVAKLEAIQKDIRVLLHNFKILKGRVQSEPENAIHSERLEIVRHYLYKRNDQQKPILAKIRSEVAQLYGNTPKSKGLQSKTKGEATPNENHGNGHIQSGQAKPAKEVLDKRASMLKRMALVRQQKKRRKRRAVRPIKTPRSPSPVQVEEDHWSKVKDPMEELGPDQFPAHVAHLDKFQVDLEIKPEDLAEEPDPIFPEQLTLSETTDQNAFMLNLGLLTGPDLTKVETHRESVLGRKRDIRDRTYVPEFTEKKQRESYRWLNATNDINSPPLLRKRRRNVLPIDLPVKRGRPRNAAGGSTQPSPPESTASWSRPDTPVNGKDEEENTSSGSNPNLLPSDSPANPSADESAMKVEAVETDNLDSIKVETSPEKEEPIKEEEAKDCPSSPSISSQELAKESQSDNQPEPVITSPNEPGKRDRVRRSKFAKIRASMESDLEKLEQRHSELCSILDGNKFTVATRKERGRINEMIKEKEEVSSQMQKIKQVLNQNLI